MKSWLVPGFITVGIFLILTALLVPNREISFNSQKNIAVVVESQGQVLLQGLDQTDSAVAKKNSQIKNFDQIQTKLQSSVLIQIKKNKAEIRISENTDLLLEESTDGTVTIIIKSGDLTVENFGEKNSLFWIKKEGRQLSALDYSITNRPDENNLKTRNTLKLNSTDKNILTQSKIEEILNLKKNDFFRCYGQLIQKEEQAYGQILLSFEILPTGKVLNVTVAKTDLNQNYFLSCLKEVVLRTAFPVFSGKNITTVFPLKFE